MTKLRVLLPSLLLTAIAISAYGQSAETDSTGVREKENEFTVGANLMTRGEVRDGGLSETDEDRATFILERTRILLNYKRKNLEVQITPQHTGVWGTSGNGSINLREAWTQLTSRQGLFIKVGRQSLTYDDERIIGLDEWSMTSAFHDALKAGYEGHGHKVHGIFVYNQNNSNMNGGTKYYDGGQVYKAMQTLWYHYDFSRTFGASLLFMNTGLQSRKEIESLGTETIYEDRTYYQQLTGGYLKYAPRNLTLEGSFYYQSGNDEHKVPIHAWMASVEGNWQINRMLKANMGYFHMSGDENYTVPGQGQMGLQHHTKNNSFNLLFGSHHQFYGAMDFFYLRSYYGGYSPGMQDLHVGGTVNVTDKLSFNAKYHYLATSVDVANCNKTLGHELELGASWKFMKDVSLAAGYSLMLGSDTMKTLKRTDDRNNMQWGWIMLSVSPQLFKVKW